ncbi:MAG TPA: ATP-binding protein [Myxococcota bacterium]|nr:ATP-binding protein [Myxococcota bacterium]HRY96868.1 ATP-binding protein [Myxococcota bacterium]
MADPETKPVEIKRWVLRRLRRLSLRWRLMIAFVVLILSSASATIFIGDKVLGTKIFELAQQKADVDLNVAWQIWESKKQEISRILNAASLYYREVRGRSERVSQTELEDALAVFLDERYFDFLGVLDASGRVVAHAPVTHEEAGRTALQEVLEMAGAGTPVASVSVRIDAVIPETPRSELMLQQFQQFGEVIVVLAMEPITVGEHSEVLYGGYIVNGRRDLVERMNDVAIGSHECTFSPCSAATIFQRDRRVSTSLPTSPSGTYILSAADERVTQRVLVEGRPYTGLAGVVSDDFLAAYRPLKDHTGRVIGMLGIGTKVAEYHHAQQRTSLLFSSLILAGMLFGFIMTWVFSRWLVKPIAQLAEGMRRVAEGELSYKVRIDSADELGTAARAFNQMVKAVKEREWQLQEMTSDRLSEVEKQISIGRLAAGVAHEINNPLTAILSLSKLMLRHTPEGDKNHEDLRIIVEETTRCREIVGGLLDFARERPASLRVVDLNAVIADTVALTKKYDALQHHEIAVESRIQPLLVEADPKQLQQVFTNLVLNAAEAMREMPDGGLGAHIRLVLDEDSSGGFAQVQVRDTGPGIPTEILNRIFEPFFTTKGKSKGTGLGLSVSLGIVRKHNGNIEVDSQVGLGTCFTVVLPLHREGTQPAAGAAS